MQAEAAKARNILIKEFFQQFPIDAAMALDDFTADDIVEYLSGLPLATAKGVFTTLNPGVAVDVIREMDDDLFIKLFSDINTHKGARLLSRLDDDEIQYRIGLLPDLVSRELKDFLQYEPDSAGYFMDTVVATFNPENTVQDVLNRIRKLADRRIMAVFIIDESGSLKGKASLQLIALSQPGEKMADVMEHAPAVNVMSTRDEVLEFMEAENILQVPVVDVNNNLLGIIRNDALIDATREEVTENIQAMFGAGREERALSKVSFAVRKRLPWLQVNLATAFLASMVVGFFEDTIAQITILAVFLPVVAGQSGNTGSQALAVTMRGLALREIRISQWFRVARKEIMVGLLNGIAIALTTGIIVYFWSASFGIAVVIAISMVVSMMIAGFSGAGIPMALKALGQDPATSSSIILTTVTDICGFLSFLGLATALSAVLGIT